MHATPAKQLAPASHVLVERYEQVLLLTGIGVRLSPTRTSRRSRASPSGPRTAPIRRAQATCVQCGLFNYLPIHLFVFEPPSAVRTQEKCF